MEGGRKVESVRLINGLFLAETSEYMNTITIMYDINTRKNIRPHILEHAKKAEKFVHMHILI